MKFSKKLPKNLLGRDFIVSDIHGCYDYLFQNLNAVNFDPSVDRVLSVGDLVDRGPDSLKCLGLLKETWFHAVMSNHDMMLLDHFGLLKTQRSDGHAWLPKDENGKALLAELLVLASELPLMLFVDDDIPFNVMHAELCNYPYDNLPFDQTKLEAIEEISDIDAEMCVWSVDGFHFMHKDRVSSVEEIDGYEVEFLGGQPMHPKLNLTYVGHRISSGVIKVFQSHVYIDSGAYLRICQGDQKYHMNLINHREFSTDLFENEFFKRCSNSSGPHFNEARDTLDIKWNGPLAGPADRSKLARAESLLKDYFLCSMSFGYLDSSLKLDEVNFKALHGSLYMDLAYLFEDYSIRRAIYASNNFRSYVFAMESTASKFTYIWVKARAEFMKKFKGSLARNCPEKCPDSMAVIWPSHEYGGYDDEERRRLDYCHLTE